jgi:integrase/recombinase XerD
VLAGKEQVARILAVSLQRRRGAKPISRWLRHEIFGLLSVIGMRVSEALNLDLEDVDLHHGILTIRNSKFGKSRSIPVRATTWKVLKIYRELALSLFGGQSHQAILHITGWLPN